MSVFSSRELKSIFTRFIYSCSSCTWSVGFPKDLGTELLSIHYVQGTIMGNTKSSLLEKGPLNAFGLRTKEKEENYCHQPHLRISQLNLLTNSTKRFITLYSRLAVVILFGEYRQNHASLISLLCFPVLASPSSVCWLEVSLLQLLSLCASDTSLCLWSSHKAPDR